MTEPDIYKEKKRFSKSRTGVAAAADAIRFSFSSTVVPTLRYPCLTLACLPDRPFHNFGASKSGAPELYKIRQSADLEALKLRKGRSGISVSCQQLRKRQN